MTWREQLRWAVFGFGAGAGFFALVATVLVALPPIGG
jgi:hypothetical protein